MVLGLVSFLSFNNRRKEGNAEEDKKEVVKQENQENTEGTRECITTKATLPHSVTSWLYNTSETFGFLVSIQCILSGWQFSLCEHI